MIDFDYKARISSLRKNMESLKIDAVVFPTDANLHLFHDREAGPPNNDKTAAIIPVFL